MECDSVDLAFMVDRGSGSEPLAEFLFDFHKTALSASETYKNLVEQAGYIGPIAVQFQDDDMGAKAGRTQWIDDRDNGLGFHNIEVFYKGIDRQAEALLPEDREQGKAYIATCLFVNEINNAALREEYDAMTQAARRGEYAGKALRSSTDPLLTDTEKRLASIDRLLARHENDGPAVHYARETERIEFSCEKKMEDIFQEIARSQGRPLRAPSPPQSFEDSYQQQVEMGHSQAYLLQYDRIVGASV